MNNNLKKQTVIGYTLIVSGITALICILLFASFGYQFVLKQNIEFEPEQSPSSSIVMSDKISIPGFETWTIDANQTTASTNFYNPEKNTCYFIIRVVLNETEEIIYESKYLKPGQHLYEVELAKSLEAGSYQATLHYSTFSMTDMTPLNGADLPFELVVN